MVSDHHLSERHACALVGLSRDTYRHVRQTIALNVELRDQIVQTAHTCGR
jgi:putative transposase